eukprot:6198529-Pleurochrysis_carterae.AAC.1
MHCYFITIVNVAAHLVLAAFPTVRGNGWQLIVLRRRTVLSNGCSDLLFMKQLAVQIRALSAIYQTFRPSASGVWAKHICLCCDKGACSLHAFSWRHMFSWLEIFHSLWADDNEAGILF